MPVARLTFEFPWKVSSVVAASLVSWGIDRLPVFANFCSSVSLLPFVSTAIIAFKWLGWLIAQCTVFMTNLMWPDRFRVSYAYLPWHLPIDLAVALIIVLLGLDAAKSFALIVQVGCAS